MTKLVEKKRPTRVTVVAILNIIIGFVYLIVGLFFESLFATMSVKGLLMGMGIWLFLQAYGFWRGKDWALYLSVVFLIVCVVFGILPFTVAGAEEYPELPDLILCVQFLLLGLLYGIFFYYLSRPQAEAFFDKTRHLSGYISWNRRFLHKSSMLLE